MMKLSDKEKENALNEVRILASIQHRSICAYHEAFIDEPSQSLWYVIFSSFCSIKTTLTNDFLRFFVVL